MGLNRFEVSGKASVTAVKTIASNFKIRAMSVQESIKR